MTGSFKTALWKSLSFHISKGASSLRVLHDDNGSVEDDDDDSDDDDDDGGDDDDVDDGDPPQLGIEATSNKVGTGCYFEPL